MSERVRFPCNDRTDEVKKLFIIWLFYCNKNEKKKQRTVLHRKLHFGLFFLRHRDNITHYLNVPKYFLSRLNAANVERKSLDKSVIVCVYENRRVKIIFL